LDGDVAWRARSLVQPGGRAPAPGELALVQSFMNSYFDLEVEHGADLFATPAALADWLAGRGLMTRADALGRGDLRRAVAAREGLRSLTRANSEPGGPGVAATLAGLNEAARGAAVEIRFAEDGPRFVVAGRGRLDGALGVLLAIAASAMIDGSWPRLKLCPGEHCGWAFYDHSRNQSGRWCSMTVCGGRAKARAHYRRLRGGGG
jgi:predicted RNA-binding Zn ribbon-like protein